MKIIHNGNHIKTIPQRYKAINEEVIKESLDCLDRKRLSESERNELEKRLCEVWLQSLDAIPIHIKKIADGRSVKEICEVTIRGDKPYKTIMLSGRIEIRFPEELPSIRITKRIKRLV